MPPFHHLAIRVRDCKASAAFYARVFGLAEVRRVEDEEAVRAVWLRAGDMVLMLEQSLRGAGSLEGSAHVLVLGTTDMAAAEQRLEALSIAVSDRTHSTVYFQDPDGHRCGLSVFRFDGNPA